MKIIYHQRKLSIFGQVRLLKDVISLLNSLKKSNLLSKCFFIKTS